MPTTYNAVAANATGTAVTVTSPNDGEALTAASANTPMQRLADWVQRLADIALPLSTLGTQTVYGVGGAGPGLTSYTGMPAYVTSWTAQAGNGCRFYKTREGIVHLEGAAVQNNGSGSDSRVIFTLPTGFRPPVNSVASGHFQSAYGGDNAAGAYRAVNMAVLATGEVQLAHQGVSDGDLMPAPLLGKFFLDGITFRAA
jgi:hypothetical protein